MKKNLKTILFSLLLIFAFVSCSTMHTVVSKRNLDVQTKMSDTIWLEPAAANERTVFVQVRNTSGKNLNIEQKVINVLTSKGYRIVNDPAEAKYWLQANILKVDKVNLDSGNGFSDAVLGAGIGGVLGAQRSGGAYTALGWGLAGAAIGTLADALVNDTAYAMVTDILIAEKTGRNVQTSTRNSVKQGNSGSMTSTSSGSSNMEKYSTRVLSTANQVNLKFDSAVPILEDELGKVIGGIF
ncbi:complement resistance protein TraT [Fusobacterium canifelinum]|uniref:Complement resistance protein TraT n=1 Tax=Fusobacterium canifelinum TaxID=285729 RepID=A0A7T4FNC3_9FUSO|nr:complement resistance protein TraT [Fusobacterium canifelinum]QQB73654.1 complement resistance protein TraT [Fusobacterium canifelinum]